MPNFIAVALRWAYPRLCEILRFCDFFVVLQLCPVLVILYLDSRPARTPGRILTVYGLNDASSPKDEPFGGLDDNPQFSDPPKIPKKGAWLGIFQPNWQNYKIAISPAGKIGSTPNFDRIIEPHSWLRGWSRLQNNTIKIQDGGRQPY